MNKEELIQRNFESELAFTASRSSGPGGQNVNKVSTRIELRFCIRDSALLTVKEKQLLYNKLRKRINSEGELTMVCQSERSQLKNKKKVIANFYELLSKSLTTSRPRISTKPTAASKRARLDSKRKRSLVKKIRGSLRDGPDEI